MHDIGIRMLSEVPPIRLSGLPLERVTYFKYLGHIVTADKKNNMDVERERWTLLVSLPGGTSVVLGKLNCVVVK